METTHHFQASHLHAIARRLFMAAGAPRHIADTVAEILVNSNLVGHDSHGVLHIPRYLLDISEGRLDPAAEPKVVKETASTLHIDGNKAFGHYIARKAMDLAIEKAKQADVCCVSFLRTGHIGRLGEYAEVAARAGCIGIITVGYSGIDKGLVTPFGGAKGALETNPIAVGVPTGDDTPFIIDFATSVIAGAKIEFADSKGEDVPEGCIVDKHGNPSVKTADYWDGGSLLPFGRHKGYALSLLTCLLGAQHGDFDGEDDYVGGIFMQVINISAFTSVEAYQRGVRAFLDNIKATPPAPGFDEVLVPGDFEHCSRMHRLANGIDVPDAIYYERTREWAEKLGVSLGEEVVEATDVNRYRTT